MDNTSTYDAYVADTFGVHPATFSSDAGVADPSGSSTTGSLPDDAVVNDTNVSTSTAEPAEASGNNLGVVDHEVNVQGDISSDTTLLAMAGGKRDDRPPPADELEEGEGKNPDGTVKRKPGKGQNSDGDIVDEAVKDYDLTPDERQRLHNEISGRGYGRGKIRQIAQDIARERGATKKPAENTPDDKSAENAPPEGPPSDKKANENHASNTQPADGKSSDGRDLLKEIRDFLLEIGVGLLFLVLLAAGILKWLETGDPSGIPEGAEMKAKGMSDEQIAAVSRRFSLPIGQPRDEAGA